MLSASGVASDSSADAPQASSWFLTADSRAARQEPSRSMSRNAGLPIKELCRKHGSCYLWRSKFGGMTTSDAKRLKELEAENHRLRVAHGVPPRERGARVVLRQPW